MNMRKISTAIVGLAVTAGTFTGTVGLAAQAAFASTSYEVLASPSLNVRSAPSTSAGVVGSLGYHTWVTIACQTTGTSVNGSNIWDELSAGRYVADYWMSTPVFNGYSPGIPQCRATPPPPPPPPGRSVGVTTNHNEGAAGQCTYWAIQQFHSFSGYWPDFTGPNNGNARYWASNAAAKHWTVVATPEVAAVAVFPPYVNGAGSVGHVAWVTAVSGRQITVTEMDWLGPYRTDTRTLLPASSVRYILAP